MFWNFNCAMQKGIWDSDEMAGNYFGAIIFLIVLESVPVQYLSNKILNTPRTVVLNVLFICIYRVFKPLLCESRTFQRVSFAKLFWGAGNAIAVNLYSKNYLYVSRSQNHYVITE